MKYRVSGILALLVVLALMAFALAEGIVTEEGLESLDLSAEETIGESADEWDGEDLAQIDDLDAGEDLGLSLDDLDAALLGTPIDGEAFEGSAKLGKMKIRVTAEAGSLPAGAVLDVEQIDPADAQGPAAAFEAALKGEGLAHHLVVIRVLDAQGSPCMPNYEMVLPEVRVTGAEPLEGLQVLYWDGEQGAASQLELIQDGDAMVFLFPDSTIYDFVMPEKAEAEETVEETVEEEAAAEEEPAAEETVEEEPVEEVVIDEEIVEEEIVDEPAEEVIIDEEIVEEEVIEEEPVEEEPVEEEIVEEEPADEEIVEEEPADEEIVEEEPVEEEPVEEEIVEEEPVEEEPIDEEPVEEEPVEEEPVEEEPAEEEPVDEEPVEEEPVEEEPAEEEPAEEEPADEEPVDEEPAEEVPAEEEPVEEEPVEEEPAEEEPVDEEPADEEIAEALPVANELTYTGEAQALVSVEGIEEGAFLYSLDGEEFTAELPAAVNAGEYTVYYKAAEGADDEVSTLTVTVAKADVVLIPPVAATADTEGTEE